MNNRGMIRIGVLAAAILWLSTDAWSHCDSMTGPVVKAGRQALEQKDVRYALIWVRPSDEPEIRSAFEKTLAVRESGAAAKALAERYFFETLVRVHRAGEGAPYTGLKDEDVQPEPGIALAERALAANSAQELSRELTAALQQQLEASFRSVRNAAGFSPADLESGRRYVADYVGYIHYVERLHSAIGSAGASHEHHTVVRPDDHTEEK